MTQAPAIVRAFTTSAPKRDAVVAARAGYKAIKEKQRMFNVDNGLRVHERGGAGDKALMGITQVLVLVGSVMWVKTVYQMAYPNGFK